MRAARRVAASRTPYTAMARTATVTVIASGWIRATYGVTVVRATPATGSTVSSSARAMRATSA
ncbi:hypothetical protein CF54_32640 [Streptomyces sp. Tu 6176]|nr:hypothetical protein CF54_32640 [Streptomyces sp. Tu 6176]